MKEVKIILRNIQSHLNTSVTIKPGLTLLVAHDNNVGKSTIFRAIDAIAQIHNMKSEDIQPLLRFGFEEGLIICEYNNQIVELHIFKRNTGMGYYFLHSKDGAITQLNRAPSELLQALDLIAPDDIKQTINIVEADKYQIVIEEGGINDSVISLLFIDQMVEHIKENAIAFNNMLAGDEQFYSMTVSKEKERLDSLSYRHCADEYTKSKDFLLKLGNSLDLVPNYREMCKFNSSNKNVLSKLENILKFMGTLKNVSLSLNWSKMPDKSLSNLDILIQFTHKLQNIQNTLNAKRIDLQDILYLEKLMYKVKIINTLYELLLHYYHSTTQYSMLLKEFNNLKDDISKLGTVIICPVKGKVVYNEERCISVND